MSDGIVPPYLGQQWRRLREKLNTVSVNAKLAAESSTSEQVAKHLGAASAALMDADFILRQIQKGRAPHQHEKSQLQESAKGGWYCAACGEDVELDE